MEQGFVNGIRVCQWYKGLSMEQGFVNGIRVCQWYKGLSMV